MKLYGSINLSKIPADLIWEAKDGSKKVTVNIIKKNEPKFDTDYTVMLYVPKDRRAEGQRAIYIGELESDEHRQQRNARTAGEDLNFAPAPPSFDK